MPDNDLVAAFKSIPIVTRTLLTATILISLGIAVNAISYYSVMLNFKAVVYRFHIHRLFTPFFVTGVNFSMLFDLYFLFTYGSQLEQSTFAGRSADFAWFVIFTCLSSAVAASYIGLPYLFQSLLIAVIYLWSKSNSDRIVSFMFGIQFKARYLPWVLMAYNYVVGGAMIPWPMIIGAASAHLYYFLDSQYPAMGGPRLIPTPSLLYRILPAQEVAGAAANFRSGGTPAADAGGHRWGTGNRLG
ncbi:Derlin 1 [Podila clonocystis]|nr:Derlin 1 [Podila clonocystis]